MIGLTTAPRLGVLTVFAAGGRFVVGFCCSSFLLGITISLYTMLPVQIITVGKTPRGALADLVEQYRTYLKPYAKLEIVGVKKIDSLPNGRLTILLDERGREMSSVSFAKWIGEFEDHGEPICFVIGGPFGMDEKIKKTARHTLALSQMTLTHDLTKILLLEQLYRAFTILRGKTYHY